MCDPETRYDDEVSLNEAKARDLKDLILSISAALRKSENETDYASTVRLVLDEYPNNVVIEILKKISTSAFSPGLSVTFWNEKLRTGVSGKEEYLKILSAIREYSR
jgi:hypothetical protein